MNAEQKMLKARTNLILDHPFFGCLALRLKLIEDKKFDTAATDGAHIWYSPEFVDSLTTQEATGVLAHEVMHVALGHFWRQGHREHEKWNIAGDYAINYNLLQAGFTLPDGVLSNHAYNNMAAEEIYSKLPDSRKTDGGKQGKKGKKGSDPGRCGGVIPAKDKKTAEQMKAEIKAAVSEALRVDQGCLPAYMQRQIKKAIETVVPWHVLLRDLVERSAKNDYNWSRPSRRHFASDIILPSLISEEIPEVAIAIDTSASITEEQLSIFAAEASAVLGAYDTTVRVIYCDAKVQNKEEETFTRADLPLEFKLLGGGGTKFAPVFEYIEEKGFTPNCLIYFTDLCGSFSEQEPDYPVMWLTLKPRDGVERTAPFGETVKF